MRFFQSLWVSVPAIDQFESIQETSKSKGKLAKASYQVYCRGKHQWKTLNQDEKLVISVFWEGSISQPSLSYISYISYPDSMLSSGVFPSTNLVAWLSQLLFWFGCFMILTERWWGLKPRGTGEVNYPSPLGRVRILKRHVITLFHALSASVFVCDWSVVPVSNSPLFLPRG